MPRVVITHAVKDLDTWLSFKGERATELSSLASDVRDHVAADGSRNVAITVEVNDLAALQAAMASPPPELAEAMDRHGVIQPLTTYVER